VVLSIGVANFAQPLVSRRATTATFRSVEFDQRLALRTAVSRALLSGPQCARPEHCQPDKQRAGLAAQASRREPSLRCGMEKRGFHGSRPFGGMILGRKNDPYLTLVAQNKSASQGATAQWAFAVCYKDLYKDLIQGLNAGAHYEALLPGPTTSLRPAPQQKISPSALRLKPWPAHLRRPAWRPASSGATRRSRS
jgi:hypothetical protein